MTVTSEIKAYEALKFRDGVECYEQNLMEFSQEQYIFSQPTAMADIGFLMRF